MHKLIVIPARGGSKGIPRKNLRLLGGRALIEYSLELSSSLPNDYVVVLSTDSEEIANYGRRFGVQIRIRPKSLAEDKVTLDPVIYDALQFATESLGIDFDLVCTMQPTSPLLKRSSLIGAFAKLEQNPEIDTILSAVKDVHLKWGIEDGGFHPLFEKRVNRQELPLEYKETGGFLITRGTLVTPNNRLGKNVELVELSSSEAIDIDSEDDWALCEYHLNRKHLVFVVAGYKRIGTGHIYNCLTLADALVGHRISFVTMKSHELAIEKVSQSNYPLKVVEDVRDLTQLLSEMSPDIIINDILDTELSYMESIVKLGKKVINFEDLGPGASLANVVINAMYPEKDNLLDHHFFGVRYFCLNDSMVNFKSEDYQAKQSRLLITFGGVDPENLTKKVLDAVHERCKELGVEIKVVLGMGYQSHESLKHYSDLDIVQNVSSLAEYINECDIVFTSAGRTTFEIASIGRPCIVLAQNERELTHFFCHRDNGFINLGLGTEVDETQIADSFERLISNPEFCKELVREMKRHDIKQGKNRVLQIIRDTINEIK